RSPGRVRGVAGTGGITSSSGSAPGRSSTSSSPVEKPVRLRSRSISSKESWPNSSLPQQVEIPPRVERDLVVGEAQGALLGLAQAGELDRGHFRQAHRFGRQQSAVTGDDDTLGIDKDRIGEPELPER